MGQIKNIKLHIVTDIKMMLLRPCVSLHLTTKVACTWMEAVLARTVVSTLQSQHFHTSPSPFTRTSWSYTRPRNTGRKIDLPRRLIDGTYYRNQQKGGRDPITGRCVIRHKGGGHQRNWRIVDKLRVPLHQPGEEPITVKDRILQIGYDPFRTGDIALVAGNGSNQTKLILAPHGLNVGDTITASRGEPPSVSRLIPGDAYPLKFLPAGTIVHSIERIPGEGAQLIQAGGMGAMITGRTDTKVKLKEVAKKKTTEKTKGRERKFELNQDCLAVIGLVSNPGHSDLEIGKAGRNRWLNRRPKGMTGKDRWHNRPKRI